MLVLLTLSSETPSFGALASQGHAGFAGQAQQGSGFKFGAGGSAGTSFETPAMYVAQSHVVHVYNGFLCCIYRMGSSFSGWRQ